ncbi:hypothetical protein BVRB_033830, partial [Beta vulgaris subsp. vulgaris]
LGTLSSRLQTMQDNHGAYRAHVHARAPANPDVRPASRARARARGRDGNHHNRHGAIDEPGFQGDHDGPDGILRGSPSMHTHHGYRCRCVHHRDRPRSVYRRRAPVALPIEKLAALSALSVKGSQVRRE